MSAVDDERDAVDKLAASEQRKTRRFRCLYLSESCSGIFSAVFPSKIGQQALHSSVSSIGPGAIPLTRMPCLPLRPKDFASPRRPPLSPPRRWICIESRDNEASRRCSKLPFDLLSSSNAARQTLKVPLASMSTTVPKAVRGKLFRRAQKISGGAVDDDVDTSEFFDSLRDRALHRFEIAHVRRDGETLVPFSSRNCFCGIKFSILRDAIATFAPASASARATPPVIPVPPPVTNATYPVNIFCENFLHIEMLSQRFQRKDAMPLSRKEIY